MNNTFETGDMLKMLEEERLRRAVRAPGTAAVMSMFWPGTGHVYTGHILMGFALSLLHLLVITGLYWLYSASSSFDWHTNGLSMLILAGMYVYTWIWSVRNVYTLPVVMPLAYDPGRPLLTYNGDTGYNGFKVGRNWAFVAAMLLVPVLFVGCAMPAGIYMTGIAGNNGSLLNRFSSQNNSANILSRLEEVLGSDKSDDVAKALLASIYQELGDMERAKAMAGYSSMSSVIAEDNSRVTTVESENADGKDVTALTTATDASEDKLSADNTVTADEEAIEENTKTVERKTVSAETEKQISKPEIVSEKIDEEINKENARIRKMAVSAHRSGDLDKARELYAQVVKNDSTDADALKNLAFICMRHKDREATIVYFKKLLRLRPANSQFNYYLGVELYRAGNYRDAVKHLSATSMPGKDYWLGMTYVELGEELKATEYLSASLSTYKTTYEALNFLGNYNFNKGNYPLALQYYEEAYRMDSSRYDLLYKIGLAKKNNGNMEEALRTFRHAAALAPADDATVNLAAREIISLQNNGSNN